MTSFNSFSISAFSSLVFFGSPYCHIVFFLVPCLWHTRIRIVVGSFSLSLSLPFSRSFFFFTVHSVRRRSRRKRGARATERVLSSMLIRVEKERERRRESDFFLLHGIERQRRILTMSYAERKLLLTMEKWQNQLMIKSRFVSYSSITLRCKEG